MRTVASHLMTRVADLIAILDGWFDPNWAEPWDAVGLVCGDPAESVDRILLAIDAVPDTVAEALDTGAQLLVTHHPLLLTPIHAVPANDSKPSAIRLLCTTVTLPVSPMSWRPKG